VFKLKNLKNKHKIKNLRTKEYSFLVDTVLNQPEPNQPKYPANPTQRLKITNRIEILSEYPKNMENTPPLNWHISIKTNKAQRDHMAHQKSTKPKEITKQIGSKTFIICDYTGLANLL
jgi:hypothetical protein